MGAKDSKPCCITYEEAVKRVTDAELKRLKEAFKRVSTLNGCITKQSFIKDVLGEGVPTPVAEYIFTACGGTQKGIALKDLLCGLVLLTRGREEEKLKFLFGLYSNESGSYVVRDELQRMLQACENGYVPDSIASLFSERDRATYEEFRDWLTAHPDATSLTRWLLSEPCSVTLSNEFETPTFYQTLAGVTHLEETDIMELEKRYWLLKGQSRTGKLDLDTLVPLISPPVPLSVCPGVFGAFDENRDSHIDFKEMACGISAACRGPLTERQKFCFKVFDSDRDGILSEDELQHMIDVLLFVRHENKSPEELATDPYGQAGDIVKGWLEREERRGYRVGQFWYLVAMDCPLSSSTNGSSPGSNTGSLKRAGRLSGRRMQQQSSLVEDCVALDNNNSVIVTGINPLDVGVPWDALGWQQRALGASPKKASSSSLSLLGAQDCSRPPSVTSSPSHSPRQPRKAVPSSFVGPPPTPGPIDNSILVATPACKVVTLTGEGGKLKRNLMLVRWRDFELVPDSLWKALFQWYGGTPALPRQVIFPKNSQQVELELYPLNLRLLRHQAQPARAPQTTWSGMVGGYGAAALSTTGYAYVSNLPTPPKRYLAYVAAFSRMATVKQVYDFLCSRLRIRPEDMRLWHYRDENNMLLIEDEEPTLEDLGILDEDQLLIEVRNKDLTWPEEMGSLAIPMQDKRKQALQCVSNTRALTQYFTGNMHLYELNRNNPLGMKGHIAKRYGDLIHDIWSGTAKTIAPLKLRWTIGKYAPRFNGFQQHDSQELLAFLLDGLHEDLNRVHDKPYVELKDSDGRPDVIVAQEAWENHILRNKSIIVDLFHGQLKSKVTCKVCGHESVRFDPFNYLSLPLPMESYVHVQVIVIRLDGSVPVKYGLRLNMDEKYSSVKTALACLCGVPAHLLRLAENVPPDDQKIKTLVSSSLYAYELPENTSSGSVSGGEEERLSLCSLKSQREAQTFTAIQRAIQPKQQSDCLQQQLANSKIQLDEPTLVSSSPPLPPQPQVATTVEVRWHNSFCMPAAFSCFKSSTPAPIPTPVPMAPNNSMGIVEEIPQLRQSSGNSSASSGSLAGLSDTDTAATLPGPSQGFIIALHRKMVNNLLICLFPHSRMDRKFNLDELDDSLGYEFPFVLKAVQKDGSQCAWCPWYRFCRGCRIQCCDAEFNFGSSHLAIDWDPTALHLRYQTSQERVFVEHESVALTRQQQSEPIDLDYCLEAFTKEEHLGEDEKYYCSKCRDHQLASKKLQIWRLPPILIVHLKRFQFVNGKWVKSQKVVNFPFKDFDPTAYLASVPKHTVVRHRELERLRVDECDEDTPPPLNGGQEAIIAPDSLVETIKLQDESEEEDDLIIPRRTLANGDVPNLRLSVLARERLESTSLARTPVTDGALQDFHQHRLASGTDPFDLKYHLYAIVSHSGILGGGHYISYACNPNGKWYCYNDSSCKVS
ncbi:hypothetical protein C0J52_07225 [Blattella germanica]|nr:hypothetical protein C0J52_07225 [Blattella germanica]